MRSSEVKISLLKGPRADLDSGKDVGDYSGGQQSWRRPKSFSVSPGGPPGRFLPQNDPTKLAFGKQLTTNQSQSQKCDSKATEVDQQEEV